jgi:hypothetical protein
VLKETPGLPGYKEIKEALALKVLRVLVQQGLLA